MYRNALMQRPVGYLVLFFQYLSVDSTSLLEQRRQGLQVRCSYEETP